MNRPETEQTTRRDFLSRSGVALAALPAVARAYETAGLVTVEPRPIDDLLANPGTGWQTFHQFADRDRALDGLPSASAYFRFYWREIEPKPGEIDIAKLDDLFGRAEKAGQRVAFRLMCTGSESYNDSPDWLKESGCKGYEYRNGGEEAKHWCPDWEDASFQKAHFRTIAGLGKRYDGHPAMDLLDIGTVGLWGEWHMSGTTDVATGKAVPMPKVETRLAIIDAWRAAFPRSPKVMLIGDEDGMRHAVKNGCGWRADCLGDMGGFSKNWNHMDHFYLQQLAKTGADDAWKRAPVAFESCWTMQKWVDEKWDVRGIFDYALRCHASYINNKSARIPDGFRPEVERLLKRLGYRLVLRRLTHAASVRRGQKLKVAMVWENTGVAPPYRDYRVALRLTGEQRTGSKSLTLVGRSVREWLPGTRTAREELDLPSGLPPGRYHLAAAIVEPATRVPSVKLAIAGRGPDGWYPLSSVNLE